MVEVVQWGITYLMIGALVQMVFQGLANVLDSPRLNTREGMVTMLVWPIALIVFMLHFVKGLLGNRKK
jgi:hypothetical protein